MASSLSLSLLLHSTPPLLHKTLNPKPQTLKLTSNRHSFSLKPLSCSPPSLSPSQVVTHQDLNEPDWSFLSPNTSQPRQQRLSHVISSASLPPSAHVLVALPTARFIDALLDQVQGEEMPQRVVAYHESLVTLSEVKEDHDDVRCFKGDVTAVPAKFAPFDAVFVCYFPAMRVSLGELLRSHAPLCSSGSRLVIFFDEGREIIEKNHRQNFPEMVISDLPNLESLKQAASANSFEIIEFIDEPNSLYLAVLKLC